MRIQSQIVIALICINAAVAFYDGLGALGVVPEYQFTHGLNQTQLTPDQAQVQYGNASELAEGWSQNPPTVIDLVGDIVGSLPSYFKVILDVFGGFTMLILQLASAVPLDPVSAAVITLFATLLATPFGFMMLAYIVELISGRTTNE